MAERDPRQMLERFVRAVNERDLEGLRSVLHPGYVEEYPQSGERIRGADNLYAMVANYPGSGSGPQNVGTTIHVVGSEDRWVMTPSFTPLRISGTGDTYTRIVKALYPDGSEWYVVSVVQFRDGLIAKQTTYFAPMFEAPDWRAQWVERMERDTGAEVR